MGWDEKEVKIGQYRNKKEGSFVLFIFESNKCSRSYPFLSKCLGNI